MKRGRNDLFFLPSAIKGQLAVIVFSGNQGNPFVSFPFLPRFLVVIVVAVIIFGVVVDVVVVAANLSSPVFLAFHHLRPSRHTQRELFLVLEDSFRKTRTTAGTDRKSEELTL